MESKKAQRRQTEKLKTPSKNKRMKQRTELGRKTSFIPRIIFLKEKIKKIQGEKIITRLAAKLMSSKNNQNYMYLM